MVFGLLKISVFSLDLKISLKISNCSPNIVHGFWLKGLSIHFPAPALHLCAVRFSAFSVPRFLQPSKFSDPLHPIYCLITSPLNYLIISHLYPSMLKRPHNSTPVFSNSSHFASTFPPIVSRSFSLGLFILSHSKSLLEYLDSSHSLTLDLSLFSHITSRMSRCLLNNRSHNVLIILLNNRSQNV